MKNFSGKKPFRSRDGGRGPKRSGSGGSRRSDGDRPYSKKSSGDKPFRKKFPGGERDGDRPFHKKSFGDKPFRKKFPAGERDGDRPFHKKSFGDKPFRKKFPAGERDGDRPFHKKSFGDKPFRKKFSSGERDGDRPFHKKSFGDKPFRKKPYTGERDGDRPIHKKSFGDKPFRKKPYTGERDGDRPFHKKSFGGKKNFGERQRVKRDNTSAKEEWNVFDNAESAKSFVETQSEKPRTPIKPAVFSGDEQLIRLNRFIANTGLCSRREADDLITAGVIKVNGKIITELGTKVAPGDTIHYGDQLLRRENMVYVLLNKPKDYITTTDDPQERKTVLELVSDAGSERIYPVGRLDRNTTGLLLLTNDGDLAQRLMHPKYGIRKIYHVSLDKNLRNEDFDEILKGIELEDGFIKADELSFVGDGADKKEVGIVLHSGRNRLVRRMFEHLGYIVTALDRVVYAGLTKKNLQRSKWRFLSDKEVGFLKMQVGGQKKVKMKRK